MHNNNILSYLENMKGRVIKIFKDGPESKTGKLINVYKDYLSIQTENNQVVYYQLMHIKSIIENSKLSMLWEVNIDQEDVDEVKAKNFNQVLSQLLFEDIQINGGGPAHRTGKLVDLKADFLVLQTNQGEVIYYQLEHIKSVSGVNKNTSDDAVEDEDEDDVDVDVMPDIIMTINFLDLLKKMKHHWIVINGKGPENIQGVLVDVTGDHITLVHHDEVFRISTFHINNISLGKKEDKSKQKDDKKEDNKKDDKKDDPKTDDKKHDKNNDHKKDDKKDDKKSDPKKDDKRDAKKHDHKKDDKKDDQKKDDKKHDKNDDHKKDDKKDDKKSDPKKDDKRDAKKHDRKKDDKKDDQKKDDKKHDKNDDHKKDDKKDDKKSDPKKDVKRDDKKHDHKKDDKKG